MKSPHDLALGLLRKASNDLTAAGATLGTSKALDTVCFHAQQAAEKSLKALLADRDITYPWTHDIGELIALVKPLHPSVRPMEADLVSLSAYGVDIRYDDALEPGLKDARRALKIAQQVHDFARKMIPS